MASKSGQGKLRMFLDMLELQVEPPCGCSRRESRLSCSACTAASTGHKSGEARQAEVANWLRVTACDSANADEEMRV